MGSVLELHNPFPKECNDFLESVRPLEGKRVKITFKSGSGSPCVVLLKYARIVRYDDGFKPQLAVSKVWDTNKKSVFPINFDRVLSITEDLPSIQQTKKAGSKFLGLIFT